MPGAGGGLRRSRRDRARDSADGRASRGRHRATRQRDQVASQFAVVLNWGLTLEKRETASWAIPLVGDHFDLEDLPLWLAGQGVHVAERNGAFELVIPVTIIGDNYKAVHAFAEEQLDLINGVGRLVPSRGGNNGTPHP